MSFISNGDGLVSFAKVVELLASGGEYDDLDFKEFWDPNDNDHLKKIVKTLASMASCPHGGYVLVGIDNNGEVTGLPSGFDERKFDTANLGKKISSYNGAFRIASNVIDLEEKRVAVIFVEPSASGFLVLEKASPDDGKEFKQGDVYIRRNTSSERPNQHDIDDVVKRIVDRELGKFRAETVFQPAFNPGRASLEMRRAFNLLEPDETSVNSVEGRLTITQLLSDALLSSEKDFETVVDSLHSSYKSVFSAERLHDGKGNITLEIVTMIMGVGALAIRLGKLSEAVYLASREVSVEESHSYVYASWIRHGQVMASRADSKRADGQEWRSLIPLTMKTVLESPALRPELLEVAESAYEKKILQQSIVAFDLIWNVWVEISGLAGHTFPSLRFHDSNQLDEIVGKLIEKPELFNSTQENLKQVIANVFERSVVVTEKDFFATFVFQPERLIKKYDLPKAE